MEGLIGERVIVIYDDSGRSGFPIKKIGILKSVDEVTFSIDINGQIEILNKNRIVRITNERGPGVA